MAAIVVLALALWGVWSWDPRKVHVVAAIGFFLPLIVLVFATAAHQDGARPISPVYWVVGSVMVLSARVLLPRPHALEERVRHVGGRNRAGGMLRHLLAGRVPPGRASRRSHHASRGGHRADPADGRSSPTSFVNRARRYRGAMSDQSSVPTRLAAFSFDDELRAAEFLTAMTRLARDKRLKIHDAVFVVKSPEGKTYVRETTDLQPGQTAMGSADVERSVRAAAGRPGRDAGGRGHRRRRRSADGQAGRRRCHRRLRRAAPRAGPAGTTTLALLADVLDDDAVLTELRRFEGARYVAGDLPLDRIAAVRAALGDAAPISGGDFPPPTDPPAT